MTDRATGILHQFQVSVKRVYLVHARFLDTVGPEAVDATGVTDAGFSLSMLFGRPSSWRRLTIAIGVVFDIEHPFRLEVMYAGEFEMSDEVLVDDRESHWRKVAAQLAPVILYPYIREVVHNLTGRSQSGELVLPVLSFLGMAEEELEIPSPPEDSSQMELEPS
jgi:preprotein translocase subunit SecB